MDVGDKIVLLFSIGALVVMFLLLGTEVGKDNCQKEAIRVGVATYVADKDGNSQFQWKTNGGNR